MLPAHHRLARRSEFTAVLRGRGARRAGGPLLVVHIAPTRTQPDATGEPPRVGFVVSRAVGNAVVRNRTTRRLRAIMASQLRGIPAGHDVVVRALPPAASASFADLESAVTRAVQRALR